MKVRVQGLGFDPQHGKNNWDKNRNEAHRNWDEEKSVLRDACLSLQSDWVSRTSSNKTQEGGAEAATQDSVFCQLNRLQVESHAPKRDIKWLMGITQFQNPSEELRPSTRGQNMGFGCLPRKKLYSPEFVADPAALVSIPSGERVTCCQQGAGAVWLRECWFDRAWAAPSREARVLWPLHIWTPEPPSIKWAHSWTCGTTCHPSIILWTGLVCVSPRLQALTSYPLLQPFAIGP